MSKLSRRRFVTIGVVATGVGLAGCTDDEIDDEEIDDDPDNGVGVDDDDGIDDETDDGVDDDEDDAVDDEEEDEVDDEEEDEVDDEEDDAVDDEEEDEVDDEPDDEEDDDEDVDDDSEERVDSYLMENDAQLYDGDIEDHTGEDEVTVAVGAGDEGFAYDPPAIRIETGTTVVWEWTGEGGGHNVAPDGDTDFDDFGDEEIVDEEGHTVEDTFDEEGVGLYVCEPHAGVGMYGGIIVE